MTEHGDKSCIGCAELPKSERALEERSKNAHDNGSLAQIEHKHDPRKSHTEAALEVCKSCISASVLAYILFVHCTGKSYGGIPSCDKICTYRGGDVEQIIHCMYRISRRASHGSTQRREFPLYSYCFMYILLFENDDIVVYRLTAVKQIDLGIRVMRVDIAFKLRSLLCRCIGTA